MQLNRATGMIFVILITYFIINLFFLTAFPFVHSDEAWLSGLSRAMSEKKHLAITEPFFDLYPRTPHAIKTIFHLIQIPFMKLFGYRVFSFRLLSLIFGTITLYFFYQLALSLLAAHKLALLATLLLAVDIQFIYASHFARQEIVLLFSLVLALYLLLKDQKYYRERLIARDIMVGVIIGLSIGIHPNSFIIAVPLVSLYLYHLLITKKLPARNFVAFSLTLVALAICFITLSFSFDPNFLTNYLQYGESLGVLHPLSSKIDSLDYFYLKLYYGVSGTYYTPLIKPQLLLFSAVLVLALLKLLMVQDQAERESTIILLLTILAINSGYIIIGRYNQTSIIFIFPLFYLLTTKVLRKKIIILVIIMGIALNSGLNLHTGVYDNDYQHYLSQIAKTVSPSAVVLANLNSEYYFAGGKLYDYRNLSYLKPHGLSFSEYINQNRIEYIIYPTEMDFIYQSRPRWNILYGNVAIYYQEMQDFLRNKCTLIDQFTNKTYGIRIARYIGKKDWQIKIYRVIVANPGGG